jgi:peptidoglycan/LPS O-acetylase OafA/YrhL
LWGRDVTSILEEGHSAQAGAKHFPQLDSLRAGAIGLVMIEHYARPIAHYVPTGAGSLGVNLFFVLSGYLIMSGLLRDREKQVGVSATLIPFYIKRFFRLFPLYYAVLAILILFGVDRVRDGLLWHSLYLSNIYPSFGGSSTIFWSLAVEEQFYLCLPFILFVGRHDRLLRRLIIALALCLAYKACILASASHLNWRLLQAAAEPLILGCLLAMRLAQTRDNKLGRREIIILRTAAIVAAVAATAIWFAHSQSLRHLFNQGLNGIFFTYIVYIALQGIGGPFGKVLNSAVLQYLGTISYGLYLVHSFVPDLLREAWPTLSDSLIALATLPLVLAVCAASYKWYEKPLLRLGRVLARHAAQNLAQRSRAKSPAICVTNNE